jgi:protein involved in polysaccharide export with SLBB domain
VTRRFEIDLELALRGSPEHDLLLELDDYLNVPTIPEWEKHRIVAVTGEVRYPGEFAVVKGERLSDVLRRAGGFTARANVKGARFTRLSVAKQQQQELERTADQMERNLLEAETQELSSAATNAEVLREERRQRRELLARLRDVEMPGRVTVKIDVPEVLQGTLWDLELEDGDSLDSPQRPSTVDVMGAVYSVSSHVYNPQMGINDYINASGGYLRTAHKRMIYLLKADGSAARLTRNTGMFASRQWIPPKGMSAVVEPGDTIIAPVKYTDKQSFESFRDAIDVIYKVAVAVGVVIN